MSTQPEPWLRGPIAGVHPMAAPAIYSFQQAREDLTHWTAGLTNDDFWSTPITGIAPLGFQIRHIGGSLERLATYLQGRQLSDEQLAAMKREQEPGATREELFAGLEKGFAIAESAVKSIDPGAWLEPRTVGRKALPTTAGGLITHMAEHTQRHVGEAIITIKAIKALREA
jgi:hypothetical protein